MIVNAPVELAHRPVNTHGDLSVHADHEPHFGNPGHFAHKQVEHLPRLVANIAVDQQADKGERDQWEQQTNVGQQKVDEARHGQNSSNHPRIFGRFKMGQAIEGIADSVLQGKPADQSGLGLTTEHAQVFDESARFGVTILRPLLQAP